MHGIDADKRGAEELDGVVLWFLLLFFHHTGCIEDVGKGDCVHFPISATEQFGACR